MKLAFLIVKVYGTFFYIFYLFPDHITWKVTEKKKLLRISEYSKSDNFKKVSVFQYWPKFLVS